MHKTLLVEALRAGKHVLCEARMAMDAQEALEMVAEARAHPHLVAQIVPSPMTLAFDATIQVGAKPCSLGPNPPYPSPPWPWTVLPASRSVGCGLAHKQTSAPLLGCWGCLLASFSTQGASCDPGC